MTKDNLTHLHEGDRAFQEVLDRINSDDVERVVVAYKAKDKEGWGFMRSARNEPGHATSDDVGAAKLLSRLVEKWCFQDLGYGEQIEGDTE